MKKGLRPPYKASGEPVHGLNIFPDEEGIKTSFYFVIPSKIGLNIFPDEEGIKISQTFLSAELFTPEHIP